MRTSEFGLDNRQGYNRIILFNLKSALETGEWGMSAISASEKRRNKLVAGQLMIGGSV